ncbi:MAG TPA: hypothetical protein VFF73_25410, partial [Planctomycetota bacterium]|nr:hypothetical protein [Planctomycetota bacterium]
MLRKTALLLVFAGALAAPALADTITFKNGHEVTGKLVEETADYVIFQVPNGKLKIFKKEIATFTQDQDYGSQYFTQPKRSTEPDNVTAGANGKAGRKFFMPSDASADEKKDLKGVHQRIEEELAKLGLTPDEHQRKIDLTSEERATLSVAQGTLGAGASVADIARLGAKCLPAMADSLNGGNSAVRADAAAVVRDAVGRGDESDVKWALGKYKLATALAAALDAAGEDASAQARTNANKALEQISGNSFSWSDNKDPVPTDAQRAATTKWKEWAKKNDADFDAAEQASEKKRKDLLADWSSMEDPKTWRAALAKCADTYGTAPSGTPKTSDDKGDSGVSSDLAKDMTADQQKEVSKAKKKIQECLDTVVGLSVEDRKKKYALTAEEEDQISTALARVAENRQKRGGGDKQQNAMNDLKGLGLKVLSKMADRVSSGGRTSWDAIRVVTDVYTGGDKDDAYVLVRAYGFPSAAVSLLSDSSDAQVSPNLRADTDKFFQAVSATSMGWPQGVTDQNPTSDETEAAGRWASWAAKDSKEFNDREKKREEHREKLQKLLKALDGKKSWSDALAGW